MYLWKQKLFDVSYALRTKHDITFYFKHPLLSICWILWVKSFVFIYENLINNLTLYTFFCDFVSAIFFNFWNYPANFGPTVVPHRFSTCVFGKWAAPLAVGFACSHITVVRLRMLDCFRSHAFKRWAGFLVCIQSLGWPYNLLASLPCYSLFLKKPLLYFKCRHRKSVF